MTLTDFLLARIAEDETRFAATELDDRLAASADLNEGYIVSLHEHLRAECAAHRQIVELHGGDYDGECQSPAHLDGPCRTLRALAAIYADHPDCRAEWRP